MLKINGWYGRGGGHIKQLVYATYFAEATKSTLRYPHHGWLKNEPISFGDNNTSINRGFFYSKDLDGHIPTVYDIYRIGKTILNSQMTCTRFSVPSDSLVIHLRSGDVFKPSPHRAYVQPPLSLYDKIIKTERYKKVIVVTDPSRSNPCLKPLVKKYSADVISIDSMRDFGYLMSATNLVLSKSNFSLSASWVSDKLKRLYVHVIDGTVPIRPDQIRKIKDTLNIDIKQYRALKYIKNKKWGARPHQIDLMLKHNIELIRLVKS